MAASLLAMAPAARPVEAAFPGINGKITFESDRDGSNGILVMNADGKKQKRLTNDVGDGGSDWGVTSS